MYFAFYTLEVFFWPPSVWLTLVQCIFCVLWAMSAFHFTILVAIPVEFFWATGVHFSKAASKWPEHPKIWSKTPFLHHNFRQAMSKWPKATSDPKIWQAEIPWSWSFYMYAGDFWMVGGLGISANCKDLVLLGLKTGPTMSMWTGINQVFSLWKLPGLMGLSLLILTL